MRKLNIGCGRDIKEGWDNVDWIDYDGVIKFDLNSCHKHMLHSGPEFLPEIREVTKPDTYDEILASHVLEHIPNILPLMQELHRVAKNGALMTIRVPYGHSDDAFEDPTHVRQYFLNSFMYYGQPAYWRANYGYYGDWKVKAIMLTIPTYMGVDKLGKPLPKEQLLSRVMAQRNVVREMIATLEAVKPIREQKRELLDQVHLDFQLI